MCQSLEKTWVAKVICPVVNLRLFSRLRIFPEAGPRYRILIPYLSPFIQVIILFVTGFIVWHRGSQRWQILKATIQAQWGYCTYIICLLTLYMRIFFLFCFFPAQNFCGIYSESYWVYPAVTSHAVNSQQSTIVNPAVIIGRLSSRLQ